jgi:putative Ca2+/H+ antiporter (TMEM165/GDT1 family)
MVISMLVLPAMLLIVARREQLEPEEDEDDSLSGPVGVSSRSAHRGGMMDWRTFAATFAAIFVAELGDKTQLAALSLSATSTSKWTVFAASALALVLSSAIAVVAGEAVSRWVPPHWLRRIAGAIFLVMGVLFLVRKG